MAGSSIMDTLFQRTLEDLIKGIRLQLIGESTFISKAMEEIRREIKSTDLHTKSIALQKLSYLNAMYGLDMSWASFHVVEVMSSSRFGHKKVGYLSASQSFNESTSVLLLITNQLRKDLSSTNEYEVSLALECLSRIATLDLANDLTPEIFTLLGSSKIFVRKKAVGVILRVFEKYPDAVRVCFKRLVENLESSDQQIVAAVVGVFCELAAKDPKSYLPLAPEFYKILIDSRNNWVLIKIVKIFSKLAPLEPRLAKKIVEPICDHIKRTVAQSLMCECIRTVVTSLYDYESAVRLSISKIRELLGSRDPNLVYLGLQALAMVAPKHLWPVLENKETVIKCLSDADPNIKLEALCLVMAMVSQSNVAEICRVLVNYALKSDPEFCNEILGSILSTCSKNVYEIIDDFDWYVSLLGEMSRTPHCQRGEEIEEQLIDIGMRVKDVRPQLVRVGRDLLIDPALLGKENLHKILCAAAWVSGEYVEFSRNPFELIEALLQPCTNLLPPSVRAVYVQSAFKVLIFCLNAYFLQNESNSDNWARGIRELTVEKECLKDHDSATSESSVSYGLNNLNPQDPDETSQDLDVEHDRDRTVNSVQTSAPGFMMKNDFTHESIISLFNLIELVLAPLTTNHDVEVLERARNVLCFIDSIKELPTNRIQGVEKLSKKDTQISNIVQLMQEAFSMELGPVSMSAQGRISVPDGLVLKENLDDLKAIYGDVELTLVSTFGGLHFEGGSDILPSDSLCKEQLEPSNESTSLLAEHRKQHGLYYLSSEKSEVVVTDYPPANDPNLRNISNDDDEDHVKLTAESLVSKKKPNQAKPRPLVVKLDEGDVAPVPVNRLEQKEHLLSDAVRDVLLGSGSKLSLLQSNPSDKSPGRKNRKDRLESNNPPEMKENMGGTEKPDHENPHSRSKNQTHGKGRKHKGSRKNGEEREETDKRDKKKSSHRHSKPKSWQRAESPKNVVSQTPVIPDFLL